MENFSLRKIVISLVSNAYVKTFVLETTDKVRPGSWEKLTASWGTAKDSCLRTSGGILATVTTCQGETDDHLSLGTANCPGQECCSFFHLIHPLKFNSLNFKTPHRTLFIPRYKNVDLERKCKMVCFRV